jgi:hypothetical protein
LKTAGLTRAKTTCSKSPPRAGRPRWISADETPHPDDPQSKVNLAVEKIFNIWQESKPERSAQLVFCDLSTPKDRGFPSIRHGDKVGTPGIPAAKSPSFRITIRDAAKLTLFRDVRAGKVRVLFGSTQKMGSGTNVQERLIALHHLDAPWRPADVEQREGRILRQGNKNPSCRFTATSPKAAFDAYMWQTLETKAKFIAQVMSGDMTCAASKTWTRRVTYAEVKAIASGNPLVIEKAPLDLTKNEAGTQMEAEDETAAVETPANTSVGGAVGMSLLAIQPFRPQSRPPAPVD